MTGHQKITDELIQQIEAAVTEKLPEGIGFFFFLAPYANQVDASKEVACKSNICQEDAVRVLKRIITRIESQRN